MVTTPGFSTILALFIAIESSFAEWEKVPLPPPPSPKMPRCSGHHLRLEEEDGCLTPGWAICRADPYAQDMGTSPGYWMFGIDPNDHYVKLWNPLGTVVYKSFPGTTELCVGEDHTDSSTSQSQDFKSDERPFVYIRYEKGDAWLYCDGIGREDKDAQMKMIEIFGEYPQHYYENPIMKFKKGSGDQNELWTINYLGDSTIADECTWYVPS